MQPKPRFLWAGVFSWRAVVCCVWRGLVAQFPPPLKDQALRASDARLMRPSAVTHSTDVEQRSIALEVTRTRDPVTVDVPADRTLVPPGWYMLFVTDGAGTPSKAKRIQAE